MDKKRLIRASGSGSGQQDQDEKKEFHAVSSVFFSHYSFPEEGTGIMFPTDRGFSGAQPGNDERNERGE
jgi:hypothetical protein